MQTLITVPLSQLRLSHRNIRRTGGGNIAELAASIRADGLLQNLTASRIPPDDSEPLERFDVIAGGRRLRALEWLRDQGELPPDHPVPVNVVPAAIATEIGLAENTVREKMHPHDEFVAFRDLAAQGLGNEAIAAKFGVTPLVVERRLRLANVAPEILRAFRDDMLTLEAMMAFAITDDHAAQLRYYSDARGAWALRPEQIRAALTHREIATTDKRARFVGVDTYEAAGGVVRRDLFDDGGSGYLLDENLLDQLVAERLQAESGKLRAEGWGFIQIVPPHEQIWDVRSKYQRIEPTQTPRETTAAEAKELARLHARVAELEPLVEDTDDDVSAIEDELSNIDDRIAALTAPDEIYTAEQMAEAGSLLYIDRDGSLAIERGFATKATAQATKKAASKAAAEADSEPADALSDSMIRRLAAHKTIALQSALMANANIALAALTHALLVETIHQHTSRVLDVHTRNNLAKPGAYGFEDVAASAHYQRTETALDDLLGTLGVPDREAQLLPWLLLQNRETLCALLAAISVLTVDAIASAADPHTTDALVAALDLDMADYWQPTAATLFAVTPRSIGLQAVQEVHGPDVAERLKPLKKDAFAGECERLLARTGWLPKLLRRPGYKTPTPGDHAPNTAKPKLKPTEPKAASKPPAKKAAPRKTAAKKAAAKKPTAAKKKKAT